MKKLGISLIAVMTLSSATLAHADCWHHCGDGGFLAFLASLYTTTTVDVAADDRAVYLQNVQDDAANFVVGGEESALLQEAIQNLRTGDGAVGTDQQIADALISATN